MYQLNESNDIMIHLEYDMAQVTWHSLRQYMEKQENSLRENLITF